MRRLSSTYVLELTMNGIDDQTIVVFPSMYLPSIVWMQRMAALEVIYVNSEERFRKSTDRNRCTIAGANGKIMLSVPLTGGRGVKSKTKDVRINYSEPWQKHHWKSIQTAYGKSSFFHFYEDRLQPFYEQRFEFLIDFNIHILQVCFEILHWTKKIETEVQNSKLKTKNRPVPVLQGKPDTPVLKPYHQVFEERHGFIPNLSILDLICTMGPEAPLFLT